jgi:CDGSH-type Zn-finger protein/uncharacterized Fe-S cluster protein YjdI
MSEERDPGSAPARPERDEPVHGVDRGDRVHQFNTTSVSVTWSRRRCIHAAECVMNLPTVFEPGHRPWIDPSQASAEAIARVVTHCPTGALHCRRTDGGATETAPAANTVVVSRHGPTYVHGDVEVFDESGALRLADTRVALCRCGQSANKPLCDGAHLDVGFRDAGTISPGRGVELDGAPGSTLRIRPLPDGPLQLEGPFTLLSADRGTELAGSGARLCRCGQSQSKPFCDGSHTRVGFISG